MDCAHCGSALRDGSKFCTNCGTRAGRAEEPSPAYQPAVAAAPAQATRRPPPGGGRLPGTIRLVAALVTLALSAITLAAFLVPAALPVWALRWLLILPLPMSAHVAEGEMILLIIVSGSAVLRTLTMMAGRAEFVVLALAYAGVVVGNAAAFPGGMSVSSYVLGQSGAIATWVCLALVLTAGIGSVFATGQPTAVALGGLVAGVVITGVSAGVAVAQAHQFTTASAFSPNAQAYLPVSSTGTGAGGGAALAPRAAAPAPDAAAA